MQVVIDGVEYIQVEKEHQKEPFRLGTIVRVKKSDVNYCSPPSGAIGKVVAVNWNKPNYVILVKFLNWNGGHNGEFAGFGAMGHRNCYGYKIKAVSEFEQLDNLELLGSFDD